MWFLGSLSCGFYNVSGTSTWNKFTIDISLQSLYQIQINSLGIPYAKYRALSVLWEKLVYKFVYKLPCIQKSNKEELIVSSWGAR